MRKMDNAMDAQVDRRVNGNECWVGMEYREDPRRCKWLARGQMRRLVGSQNAKNKPAQIARGSWPDGGDAQEMDGHSRMQSDWAVLAIGGAARHSTINPVGSMV